MTAIAPADVVERALALSRADGCVVLLSESSGVNLRWAGSTLTTNGSARTRSLVVISVIGESVGIRSASVLDDVEGVVRASEQAAREAEPAEDYAPLLDGDADPSFAEGHEGTSTSVLSGFAAALGERFEAARADGLRLYGFAEHDVTTTWLGTSTGIRRRHVQPTGTVEVTGKSTATTASAWVGQHTRDWSDVSADALDAELRRRLGWAGRQVELPAGRYDVVLPPGAVGDLLVPTYWSMAGRDAFEGRTVFSKPGGGTRVGERIGPAGFRLWSDPDDPELAVAPFVRAAGSSSLSSVFDNGLAVGAQEWVRDGHLASLVQTRATSRLTGEPVAPFVGNLCADAGGTATTDDLVTTTERGLLLTCLWYIREVDPETLLMTGLTRDGVYLVEHGEVVGAVNNFRWNESPVDVLGRLAEVGRTEHCMVREWADDFPRVRMPAVRVPGFNMSSVSQAS